MSLFDSLFGSKKGFGLDISDSSIEVLELEKVSNEIKVKSYGRLQIPNKEYIENGEIKQKEPLIKSIKEVIDKAEPEKIRTRNVVISIPESRVFTHFFDLPINLKTKEIKEALSYEIESIFPYSSKELYLDFKIISRKEKTQEIFVAASPIKIINDFKEVIEGAGLKPIVFDMESKSLARALIDKFEKNQAIMILDIGARTSIISIFDEVGLRLTSNIKLAGNRFTKEVASVLNISLEEAEKIKIKEGFLSEKFGEALKKAAQILCQEVKKEIKFTEERYQFKISKIILAGGSSLLPGIKDYLEKEISLPMENGNPLIKLSKDNILAKKEKSILFADVIGLALRALEKDPIKVDINLLKG